MKEPVQTAKFPKISHFLTSLAVTVNAMSRKSLEIQAYSVAKLRTHSEQKLI